ncbi:MAG TPA: hypothetical protein VG122_19430, partial [Gemmata sp.]|nr:hypothetical protein [Gemmata sp.]
MPGTHRSFHRAGLFTVTLGLLSLFGISGCREHKVDVPTTEPGQPAQPRLPADIELQVHTFCGGACHAYPPADSFPRK